MKTLLTVFICSLALVGCWGKSETKNVTIKTTSVDQTNKDSGTYEKIGKSVDDMGDAAENFADGVEEASN